MVSEAARRIFRVGVSSVVATAVDVGTLILLVEVVGCPVTLAAFLSACMGGVTNFLVNKFWAFADGAPIDVRQVTLYALVSLVNAAFVAACVHVLAVMMGMPYLWAKAIAAIVVFLVWSYPAQAKLVFPATQAAPERRDTMPTELALD